MCYDHLAGSVGVAILERALKEGWVRETGVEIQLTEAGQTALRRLSIDPAPGRGCMDWSERRPHLAGPLGRNITLALLALGWLQRDPKSRALWVTPSGEQELEKLLGYPLPRHV